jgi:type II secretion system protein H
VGPLTAARRLHSSKSGAFTLVEILVVLAILAVAGGIVAMTLAPDERGTTLREARRFAGAIEYAAARAQSRGETLGVAASGSAIRFWRKDPQDARWHALDDDTLAPRALPAPLAAAALTYAGQRVPGDAIVPLKPTGRNEPFAFVVTSPSWRVALAADPLNRVAVADPVATAP